MKASGSSREKLLMLLKTKGPRQASQIARDLHVTPMAVRQHLNQLLDEQLVEYQDERRRVGRPARIWRLTEEGHSLFPSSLADFTTSMLDLVQATFGDDGIRKLMAERARRQVESYRERIPDDGGLDARVAALARIRRDEGYMADWKRRRDGTLELCENHCSVCAAARSCPEVCRTELEVFREVLGPGVDVVRDEHIMSGQRRCLYRITPQPAAAVRAS